MAIPAPVLRQEEQVCLRGSARADQSRAVPFSYDKGGQ